MEKARKLILSVIIISMVTSIYAPLYAEKALEPIPIINNAECTNFCDWVNTAKKDTEDDADALRAEWKQALGVDIFFAHFKAEEITHKIEEKSKFKLFNMSGRAKIKQDSAIYTFSHKF